MDEIADMVHGAGRALTKIRWRPKSKHSIHFFFPLAFLLAFFHGPRFSAAQSFTDGLASRGKLGIEIEAARSLEGKLGQLFIVNVDGFGYSGRLAVSPPFMEMVERLQVGGVIPHYGSNDFEKIRRTNRALAGLTRLPLMICSDIVGIRGGRTAEGNGKIARFGDGYVGGFIRQYGALPESEFGALCRLNAFVLAASGINVSLGPTVDDSTGCRETVSRARAVIDGLKRFGVEPVLKHYPFLPGRGNLHRESPDTRTPAEEVTRRTAVFGELRLESGILMTTHLFDSLVDGGTIVTFSPVWRGRVRGDTGFSGLFMSDDILMLRNYRNKSTLGAEAAGGDPASWALAAVLAGHDFIIMTGSEAVTAGVFEKLLSTACAATETGSRLRERIKESFNRISRFKESRRDLLTRRIDVPSETIETVVSLVPAQGSADFRFDSQALSGISPRLEAAALPPSFFARLISPSR